jgi:hypothetical protein
MISVGRQVLDDTSTGLFGAALLGLWRRILLQVARSCECSIRSEAGTKTMMRGLLVWPRECMDMRVWCQSLLNLIMKK